MTLQLHKAVPNRVLAWLLACCLLGLGLRVAAAMNGLWIDEAWSAVFAREVAPVTGVFSSINHDNNHHLNTLWLQLVGSGAPPMLMRGLSILCSVVTIGVAGAIALRRGATSAVMTALFFAVSPIMVLYGSEARGYAPFMFALAVAIYLIDGWLDVREGDGPVGRLALVAGLGTLSHMMMAPALVLLSGWIWLFIAQREGVMAATRRTSALMMPALITCATFVLIAFAIAHQVARKMQVGGYIAYDPQLFSLALRDVVGLSTGLGLYQTPVLATAIAGFVLLILLAGLRPRSAPGLALLIALMVAGLPLAVFLLHPGNSQYARYYLIVAVALLLFLGNRIGALLDCGGARRWAGAGLMLLLVGGSLGQVYSLVIGGRGHVDAAVDAMAAMTRAGRLDVLVDNPRASAVLEVAAAQRNLPIRIATTQCETKRFWFIERERGTPVERSASRCGQPWVLIASDDAYGPSGQSWSLYQKRGLPMPIVAVNSPPPTQ
jgi:Dolichyl-phosphate-mannose-protein mannosyltransferase